MDETDCRFSVKTICYRAQSEQQMKVCPFTDKIKCKDFMPDTKKGKAERTNQQLE